MTSKDTDHLVCLFSVIGPIKVASTVCPGSTEASNSLQRPRTDCVDAHTELILCWLEMLRNRFSGNVVH